MHDTSTRGEVVYQLRKLAEAWWNLAAALERGENVEARITALLAITEQATVTSRENARDR
jgi:hypothetical protein